MKLFTPACLALLLPAAANAATTYHELAGTFGSSEQGCTQIAYLFGGSDCTYGRNRLGAAGTWIGPLFTGAHYPVDGVKDQVTYVPTNGVFNPDTATFTPAADDGKLAAPMTGTFAIDDNNTPGDPTDDLVSGQFSIGQMARNVATGQATRAVQRWTSMDHVIGPTAVNPAATVPNGAGGVDYVIGSRGFPAPLCSATNGADCFPSPNASASFSDFDTSDTAVSFWAQIAPGSIGIESSGLLGDPSFVNVQPPPIPPTGNVGATSTATFIGYSCSTSNVATDDCVGSALVWGAGEQAGFDNIVMKISTDGTGQVTALSGYWVEEFAIAFGGPPAGYPNSWQGGAFSFGPAVPPDPDPDGDGVIAALDNCTEVPNPSQCDSDQDGYGNHCDADLTNNGVTNAQDAVILRNVMGAGTPGPLYNIGDLNCNGVVNAQDTVLLRQRLGTPPGPSGLVP